MNVQFDASRLRNRLLTMGLTMFLAGGCASGIQSSQEIAHPVSRQHVEPTYLIGPGDRLQVFVWGNPELSATVSVRPDGRITTPLIEDIVASGKQPSQLARMMEQQLAKYIKNPVVTVIVTDSAGRYSEQIRVVGEAVKPQMLPYKEHMSLLDVIIAVGGITEFAAGNRATIVRNIDGEQQKFRVHLDDLIKRGDINDNVEMMPGDILIIPESFF